MSIGRENFDQIVESDLQTLIETGVPEGIVIDYKREPYGGSEAEKKEFLKDLSSFANTNGGHLIIGMSADDGIPVAIAAMIEAAAT
jgi:predicted HTH transcriptional regulator